MSELGAIKRALNRIGKPGVVKEILPKAREALPRFRSGRRWLRKEKGVLPVLIDPGSPWQNGFVESFNGKHRDECLNGELFFSRAEAQVVVDGFRKEDNTERPHSASGYRTPAEVAGESFKERRN